MRPSGSRHVSTNAKFGPPKHQDIMATESEVCFRTNNPSELSDMSRPTGSTPSWRPHRERKAVRVARRDDLRVEGPLAPALVGGGWDVALKVHPVVQNADDFDRVLRRRAVHEEMASTTTVPSNMERAKTGHDLVPRLRVRNIGTIGKLADRLNEGVAIDARLPHA